MSPPQPSKGKIPYRLYNLGGGLANLLVSLIALALLWLEILPQELALALIISGLFFGLTNLIPSRAFINNDGANIQDIARHSQGSLYFGASLAIHARLIDGQAYKDMPSHYFLKPAKTDLENPIILSASLNYLARLIDQGNFSQARDYLLELDLDQQGIMPFYQVFLKSLLIYCQLILKEKPSIQLTKQELKAIDRLAASQPSLLVFNYAYYHLVDKNKKKAEKSLTQLAKLEKNYPFPAELATEKRNLARFQEIVAKQTGRM